MLLLTVLIAVAVTGGLIAVLIARWCQRLLHGTPATEAAAHAVAHAAGPGHAPTWWRARLHPGEATGLLLTMGAAIVIAGGVVIGVLAYLVRGNDTLRGIDTSAADWGARHATEDGTAVLQRITDLGDTRAVVLLAVVVAAVELWRAPSRFIIPFLVAVTLGNWLVTTAIKDLADRARPTLNPIAETLGTVVPERALVDRRRLLRGGRAAARPAPLAAGALDPRGHRRRRRGPGGRHARPAGRALAVGHHRRRGARLVVVHALRHRVRWAPAAVRRGRRGGRRRGRRPRRPATPRPRRASDARAPPDAVRAYEHGGAALTAVALGLVVFGAYSLMDPRYRKI